MRFPEILVILNAFLSVGGTALAQERISKTDTSRSVSGIADNSFLIEEAYNQEAKVVQHISNFSYAKSPSKNLAYTFTQEWPIDGQTHQLSYTIPYASFLDLHQSGIGDVLINYRYQLFGGDGWAWVAPRLSVILPTGDDKQGLGSGSYGLQANVALSKDLSRALVVHGNIGSTLMLSENAPVSVSGGASLIWRVAETLNFMLEGLAMSNAKDEAAGGVTRETVLMINPGLRFALNFSELQVVPGIGVPISFRNGEASSAMFLYLSFEHPF